MKPARLFTMLWGRRYVEWFEAACAKSLCWPLNKEAAKSIEAWDLWVTPEEEPRVSAIASGLGIPLEVHPVLDGSVIKPNFRALVEQIAFCAERKASFLFAAPDSIFGDGSVRALLEMGSPPRVCVAAAPLRVNETILQHMGAPLANPALVKLGLQHMHRSFADGKVGERTNTLASGISWKPIGKGLFALQYRHYSAYLMTPEQKDVDWFRKYPRLGYYDSKFPETLIPDQRQRVVGSSDAVFVCELTPLDRPLPPVSAADAEQDKYEGNLAHHIANRGVMCIWRAECN